MSKQEKEKKNALRKLRKFKFPSARDELLVDLISPNLYNIEKKKQK